MDVEMIDTAPLLEVFLANLPEPTAQPNLYADLEGNNLSRHDTLSLITILVEPATHKTLQQILESKDIIKVFFDIRNDSDALFSLFKVRVAGVEDIQLMEVASRTYSKRPVNGLAECISGDAPISFSEKRDWRATKDEGHHLFYPAQGGSFAVFDKRLLAKAMKKHCMQDVLHMPGLRDTYRPK